MAKIIPPLTRRALGRMTSGEKRVARRLQSLLEDDYVVWYDIPVGKSLCHPDFVILHPTRGILLLEVKDWKAETLRNITKTTVDLLTNHGMVTRPHPLEQVRHYAYEIVDMLSKDPALQQASGSHRGKLIVPYGWGVVFTNITRSKIQRAIPEDARENVLPDHLAIYKDDITETADAEAFQSQLWGMFTYQFGSRLTLPQIDRIRWHLYPEIRIDQAGQPDMFADSAEEHDQSIEEALPDIVKVMDIQQEQLARSLSEGHRVIHGVSGSGKTLILGYRCLHLAQATRKPILVLCFNITLAAKLRSFIADKGVGDHVQVYHFHDWCGQQLKTYHVDMVQSDKEHFEQQVDSVIQGVEKGHIPRAQYGALLIDEGHDFQPNWLELVVQMVDPDTNSLLLLYDDAQSIYKKSGGLGFSLSSVGIQAKGRTTVLRLNYRNTKEILECAYEFARQYLERDKRDDEVPLVEPEAAGKRGVQPAIRKFDSVEKEAEYAVQCIRKWREQGVPFHDIAVLHPQQWQGRIVAEALKKARIPRAWLSNSKAKKQYDPRDDKIAVMTIHSSKGLEFPRVILVGIGQLDDGAESRSRWARLLYVGMTRAQDYLLMTTSRDNHFSRELMETAG